MEGSYEKQKKRMSKRKYNADNGLSVAWDNGCRRKGGGKGEGKVGKEEGRVEREGGR